MSQFFIFNNILPKLAFFHRYLNRSLTVYLSMSRPDTSKAPGKSEVGQKSLHPHFSLANIRYSRENWRRYIANHECAHRQAMPCKVAYDRHMENENAGRRFTCPALGVWQIHAFKSLDLTNLKCAAFQAVLL